MKLPTILFLIFLVLKLTNHISWSWVWVTSPLWVCFLLWIVFFIGAFIYYAFIETPEQKLVRHFEERLLQRK